MISWFQINLQKHFRVVFIILLVSVIVSFVFVVGNQGSFMSGQKGGTENLRFFEVELNTQAKQAQFSRNAELSGFLGGNARVSPIYAFERATALHIANEHKLPGPNKAQMEAFVKTRPIFRGMGGEFDPQAYTMMIDNLKLMGSATEEDIARILSEDYRIEKVYDLLQGPGFVSQAEILDALRHRTSKYSVLTASLNLTNYNPEFEVTEEQLKEYYNEFGFKYETPTRRSVDYVEFDAAAYVDDIEADEDDLINYFEANIQRYQPTPTPPAEGEEAVAPEPVTYEQVRPAVQANYHLEKARDIAMEKAIDFVADLINKDGTLEGGVVDRSIKEHGLSKKTSSNFARNETPIGTTWGPPVVNPAFLLSKSKFYSEPIQHGNKSIVLFYKSEVPSIIPSYETLRDKIERDLRTEKLREMRVEHGTAIKEQLAANATDEETFGAFAEENGLSVTAYTDFSLTEPKEGLNTRLLNTIVELDVSEVSDMIKLSEEEGVFVYLLSKEVPEVSTDDEEYQNTKDGLTNLYHRFATSQYIEKLITEEAARSNINPFGNN